MKNQVAHHPARSAFLPLFCVFSIAVIVISCRQPLQVWDEGRVINNALELASSSKTWMITTYNGIPDHWYTKPPLYPWIVTGLLHLGLHPLPALRLPSIIAALLSVLEVYLFCAVLLRRPFVGIIGALFLMCSTTFFGPHIALTGDLDALLSFLEVAYVLCFWAFLEQPHRTKTAWLVLSCISLSLAIMTKGIAGILFLPGLFIFILLRPDRLKVLADWRIWIGLLAAAAVPLSYYLYRNVLDPGYLQAVRVNELQRFTASMETHHGGPFFYVIDLIKGFEPGMLSLVVAFLVLRRSVARDARSRSAAILCAVVALVFLLVLTQSKTKTLWYDAPAMPLLAMLAGLGVVDTLAVALARLRQRKPMLNGRWLLWALPLVLASFALGFTALRAKHVEAHLRDSEAVGYGREFNYLSHQGSSIHRVVLLAEPHWDENKNPHYFPVEEYWAKTVAKQENIEVQFANNASEVPDQSWVISCAPSLYSVLQAESRVVRVADSHGHCLLELTTQSQAAH